MKTSEIFPLLLAVLLLAAPSATGEVTVISSFPTGLRPTGMVIHPGLNRGYVSGFADSTVEVYDLDTETLLTTIPVAVGPMRSALSPDGTLLAVPCLQGRRVFIIGTADNLVDGFVPTGRFPIEATFSPDGSRVYSITSGSAYSFDVIDPVAVSLVAQFPLPITSLGHGFAFSPDGSLAIVTNPSGAPGDTATFVHLQPLALATLVPVGVNPVDVVFSSDGTTAWVANNGSATLSRIDVATRSVTGTFPTALGPTRLAWSEVGQLLVVVHDQLGVTQIRDGNTGAFLAEAPTPGISSLLFGRTDIEILPSTPLALVSGPFASSLYVLDVDPASPGFGSLQSTILIGGLPSEIVISPDGSKAYVLGFGGGRITVLSLPTAVESHFKCYEADGDDVNVSVTLEDQFGVEPEVLVEEPEFFCNPVAKTVNGEVTEIGDPTAHLTGYEIEGDQAERIVTISNQFGEEQALLLKEAKLLFAPSEKDGQESDLNLDYFKCYEAEGNLVNVIVGLEDQFGDKPAVLVGEPKLFCNPVDKNGEGINDPAAHLTCYEIEAGGEVERVVVVANQFGEQTLEVEDSELLCVPSAKIDVIVQGDDDDEEDDD